MFELELHVVCNCGCVTYFILISVTVSQCWREEGRRRAMRRPVENQFEDFWC